MRVIDCGGRPARGRAFKNRLKSDHFRRRVLRRTGARWNCAGVVHYDVIKKLDIMMPKNGWSGGRTPYVERGTDTPVLLFPDPARRHRQDRCGRPELRGADDYLVKPPSPVRNCWRVSTCWRRRKRRGIQFTLEDLTLDAAVT